MNTNKINELFADEAFVKKVFSLETPEQALEALNAKGASCTLQDVMEMRKAIMAQESGEMSEEDLSNVAGGTAFIKFPGILNPGNILGPGGRPGGIITLPVRRW